MRLTNSPFEVGVLAEVHRNCVLSRVCQVDLSDNYEHKHQPLTLEDPDKGLLKMGTWMNLPS